MSERLPSIHIQMGDMTFGLVKPLPASLTDAQLTEALDDMSAPPMGFDEWLTARLRDVTGRPYTARTDPRTFEQDGQGHLVYEGIRITEDAS